MFGLAEINGLCSPVLQGFAAPASDAPVQVVNVYGQRMSLLPFAGLFRLRWLGQETEMTRGKKQALEGASKNCGKEFRAAMSIRLF